jgi:hypothetical protein
MDQLLEVYGHEDVVALTEIDVRYAEPSAEGATRQPWNPTEWKVTTMQPLRPGDPYRIICPACGEQITTTNAQLIATAGWENRATGEYVHEADVGAVHAACYMRLTPPERLALLDDISAAGRVPTRST